MQFRPFTEDVQHDLVTKVTLSNWASFEGEGQRENANNSHALVPLRVHT